MDSVDYAIANSEQIEKDLCGKLVRIRLMRNMTQKFLAEQAGVSVRTVRRLEKGLGVSLDTFIRILPRWACSKTWKHCCQTRAYAPLIGLHSKGWSASEPKQEK